MDLFQPHQRSLAQAPPRRTIQKTLNECADTDSHLCFEFSVKASGSIGAVRFLFSGGFINIRPRWVHEQLSSQCDSLPCEGGPRHHSHQGARCAPVIPSVGLDPRSFTFVIVLTDVNVGSTLHHILLFIPLETSFCSCFNIGLRVRRRSDARTSAACLSDTTMTAFSFYGPKRNLCERGLNQRWIHHRVAAQRGKRTKMATGSSCILEA